MRDPDNMVEGRMTLWVGHGEPRPLMTTVEIIRTPYLTVLWPEGMTIEQALDAWAVARIATLDDRLE